MCKLGEEKNKKNAEVAPDIIGGDGKWNGAGTN
jgi:hypothetical protein